MACVCVCVCVCAHTCAHVCVCTCVWERVRARVHVCARACARVRVHVCVCGCLSSNKLQHRFKSCICRRECYVPPKSTYNPSLSHTHTFFIKHKLWRPTPPINKTNNIFVYIRTKKHNVYIYICIYEYHVLTHASWRTRNRRSSANETCNR